MKFYAFVLVLFAACSPTDPFVSFAVPSLPDDGCAPVAPTPATPDEDGGEARGAGDSGVEAATGNDAATDSPEAAPGADGRPSEDACVPVTHVNGVGQSWSDCVPVGTHDEAQAMKACLAKTGNASACSSAPGCGSAPEVVQGTGDGFNYLWGYEGNTAGFVGVDGSCPNSDGKEWR